MTASLIYVHLPPNIIKGDIISFLYYVIEVFCVCNSSAKLKSIDILSMLLLRLSQEAG